MYNLVRADIYKMQKSLAMKIIFGITVLCAIAMTVIAYLIPKGQIDKTMSSIGFMFSDANVISLLGAVLAGIFICGDFENKSIHDAIAAGYSRITVVISKTITFCLALTAVLLPYVIVTGIGIGTGYKFNMGSLSVSFLNVLTTEAGKALTAADIWKLVAVMLGLLIVYLGRLSLCIPLALVLKKPILVVAIYYGFTIIVSNLSQVAANNTTVNNILKFTPLSGDYGFLTLSTGSDVIWKAIAVNLVCTAIMAAITYLAFRKAEIK